MTLRSIAIRRRLQYSDTPRIRGAEVLNGKLKPWLSSSSSLFSRCVFILCANWSFRFLLPTRRWTTLYERRKVKFRWMFRCRCFKPIRVNRVVATFFCVCAIIEASALCFHRKQNFMSAAITCFTVAAQKFVQYPSLCTINSIALEYLS